VKPIYPPSPTNRPRFSQSWTLRGLPHGNPESWKLTAGRAKSSRPGGANSSSDNTRVNSTPRMKKSAAPSSPSRGTQDSINRALETSDEFRRTPGATPPRTSPVALPATQIHVRAGSTCHIYAAVCGFFDRNLIEVLRPTSTETFELLFELPQRTLQTSGCRSKIDTVTPSFERKTLCLFQASCATVPI